ncbi:MAG: hypothetical protein V4515_12680 [Chloroflexota bacterium]
MSNRKPNKVAVYFFAEKPLIGGIWVFNAACWIYSAAMSLKTYRLRVAVEKSIADRAAFYGGPR